MWAPANEMSPSPSLYGGAAQVHKHDVSFLLGSLWIDAVHHRRGASQAPVPIVVVLGSNPSTWLLGNRNVFRVSDSAESCTEEPLAAAGNCFGKYASYDMTWQVAESSARFIVCTTPSRGCAILRGYTPLPLNLANKH